MRENKFIVTDATDVMCIGGFGNDLGNKGLLKYSEEEIAKMIMENNNTTDNTRLANSLLRTIRNQDNIINELENWLYEQRDNLDKSVGGMKMNDKNLPRANHYIFIYNRAIKKLQELKGSDK